MSEEEKLIKKRLAVVKEMQEDARNMRKWERAAVRISVFAFLFTLAMAFIYLFFDRSVMVIFFGILSLVNWFSLDKTLTNAKASQELEESLNRIETQLYQTLEEAKK